MSKFETYGLSSRPWYIFIDRRSRFRDLRRHFETCGLISRFWPVWPPIDDSIPRRSAVCDDRDCCGGRIRRNMRSAILVFPLAVISLMYSWMWTIRQLNYMTWLSAG